MPFIGKDWRAPGKLKNFFLNFLKILFLKEICGYVLIMSTILLDGN